MNNFWTIRLKLTLKLWIPNRIKAENGGKRMKRFWLILIVIAGIQIFCSQPVLAATGLSEAEELILDKLREGTVVDGELRYIPVSYLNQIENEMIRNKTDLNMEQADVVLDRMDKILQFMEEMHIQDVMNIENSETAFKFLTMVSEAASEIGYSVSVDLVDRTINIENPEGEAVLIANNTINQTGFTYQPLLTAGAMLLSVFLSCLLAYIRWTKMGENRNINRLPEETLGTVPEDGKIEWTKAEINLKNEG